MNSCSSVVQLVCSSIVDCGLKYPRSFNAESAKVAENDDHVRCLVGVLADVAAFGTWADFRTFVGSSASRRNAHEMCGRNTVRFVITEHEKGTKNRKSNVREVSGPIRATGVGRPTEVLVVLVGGYSPAKGGIMPG